MLKKNQPVKLSKPDSTMSVVHDSIKQGNHSLQRILVHTKKKQGAVKSALYNLSHIGMIEARKINGATRWFVPDQLPKDFDLDLVKQSDAEKNNATDSLIKNTICTTNNQIRGRGRPKKEERVMPFSWRPKSEAARQWLIQRGGAKFLDRLAESGLLSSR